jgi:hypothetical protein
MANVSLGEFPLVLPIISLHQTPIYLLYMFQTSHVGSISSIYLILAAALGCNVSGD